MTSATVDTSMLLTFIRCAPFTLLIQPFILLIPEPVTVPAMVNILFHSSEGCSVRPAVGCLSRRSKVIVSQLWKGLDESSTLHGGSISSVSLSKAGAAAVVL